MLSHLGFFERHQWMKCYICYLALLASLLQNLILFHNGCDFLTWSTWSRHMGDLTQLVLSSVWPEEQFRSWFSPDIWKLIIDRLNGTRSCNTIWYACFIRRYASCVFWGATYRIEILGIERGGLADKKHISPCLDQTVTQPLQLLYSKQSNKPFIHTSSAGRAKRESPLSTEEL